MKENVTALRMVSAGKQVLKVDLIKHTKTFFKLLRKLY